MVDSTVNGSGFALGLHTGRKADFFSPLSSQTGGTSFLSKRASGQSGRMSSHKNFVSRLARHASARAGRTSLLTGSVPGLTECASDVSGCTSSRKFRTFGVAGGTSGGAGRVSNVTGRVSGVDRCMVFSNLRNFRHFDPFPDGSPQPNTQKQQK